MITIIAGTNRIGSNTKKIAKEYSKFLSQNSVDNKLLSLDEYNVYQRNDAFMEMENKFLKKADRFIFIVPEYNGSFPGILKLLIDNSDVGTIWPNKKALLVGVSTGRAGNLRGLEHLTGSLMHLKMSVHPNRLPLSVVHTLLNEQDILINEAIIKTIKEQIDDFINY